jgi:hypothetical protein
MRLRTTPLRSGLRYAGLRLRGRVTITTDPAQPAWIRFDDTRFRPFRHIRIDAGPAAAPAVFWARFDLQGVSAGRNRRRSALFLPFFAGLPGFREKFWCVDEDGRSYLGLYEWTSAAAADAYRTSYAPAFMAARAAPGSVRFGMIAETTLAAEVARRG